MKTSIFNHLSHPCIAGILLFLTSPHLELEGQSLSYIAQSAIGSTVTIIALDADHQPLAYGSGFAISETDFVTNFHVIENSAHAIVIDANESIRLTVKGFIGFDEVHDLAILHTDESRIPPLPVGNSYNTQIGDKVYAVGNPKGLSGTFSEGIVSGIRTADKNRLLQITAPISPGSSGGPVINSTGKVIGVAVSSLTSGQNLNFAVPIEYIHDIIDKAPPNSFIPYNEFKSIPNSQSNSSNSSWQPPTTAPMLGAVEVINLHGTGNYIGNEYEYLFSVKNNTDYDIDNIRILFLTYTRAGVLVDSKEIILGESKYHETKSSFIRAHLAKAGDVDLMYDNTYKRTARVLDFRIVE